MRANIPPGAEERTASGSSEGSSEFNLDKVCCLMDELKPDENIEPLANITKKYNGTMKIVHLFSATRETSRIDPNAQYFITEPLFLGQLPFWKFENKGVGILWKSKGEQLAFLFNKMLEIYTGRTEEFLFFSKRGEMIQTLGKPTAAICAFLLRSDEQFSSLDGEVVSAADFLVTLYAKHFLFQCLANGKVVLMHFPETSNREKAKAEINGSIKTEVGVPSKPIVLEKILHSISEERVSRLFVMYNGNWCPLGSSASIFNFTQPYTLAEIGSYDFVVSKRNEVQARHNIAERNQKKRADRPLLRSASSLPTNASGSSEFNPEKKVPCLQKPVPAEKQHQVGSFQANQSLFPSVRVGGNPCTPSVKVGVPAPHGSTPTGGFYKGF